MKITVQTHVAAPIAVVWRCFNNPDDIVQWDASDAWHTIWASNDLTVGGRLQLRIEANDKSSGFDFVATYAQIQMDRLIEFIAQDGTTVTLEFTEMDAGVMIRQTFDAAPQPTQAQQRAEWLSVLHRFARYAERQG